ncbi:hypothetical protein HHL21_08605 [Massilia sp. RP-1-19]|uniref:Uncharacterized protein n=1 Tax=Massilia polaris TaxID=2728846 RepID=A0A848HLY1_9BURK|nr:hypothetical protein [Massilia polaris]NML61139.1 hypothetical protein [Massilia polaris]
MVDGIFTVTRIALSQPKLALAAGATIRADQEPNLEEEVHFLLKNKISKKATLSVLL